MSRVPPAIRAALRRRGIKLRESEGGRDDLLIASWSSELIEQFYREMQRYSFRLVLRDVIRLGGGGTFEPQQLTRHASLEVVHGFLEILLRLSVIQPAGQAYRLGVPAHSLGPTLEWFVAQVLQRELGFCVASSLPMRGGTTGGDLDVMGLAEGCLLYVEVKSGPPKHLGGPQISAFLDRVEALAPHGAIFFEDTELRMKDKIVVLFEEALQQRGSSRRPERLHRELFTVGRGIYIANAHPDVAGNLARCVSHLLRAMGVQLGNGA
jgi:hypothetical protein